MLYDSINRFCKWGGPDETILSIISIIFIVFGVLQIILFFKVWGMTNNVKEIRNSLGQGKARIDMNVRPKVRLLLLQGNKDAARCLLIKQFASVVEEIYYIMISEGCDQESIDKKDITALVQEFGERMQSLGMELPEEFAQLKTVDDYFKLYSPHRITFDIRDCTIKV